jgi:hypothetical protein
MEHSNRKFNTCQTSSSAEPPNTPGHPAMAFIMTSTTEVETPWFNDKDEVIRLMMMMTIMDIYCLSIFDALSTNSLLFKPLINNSSLYHSLVCLLVFGFYLK